jgi:PAS domain S-box-containing protein
MSRLPPPASSTRAAAGSCAPAGTLAGGLHATFCAHFVQLFESVPVGVVVLDLSDRVVRANPAFCRMFGYGAETVVGASILDLIVPDFLRAEARSQARSALHQAGEAVETVRHHRDGSPIEVSMRRVVLRDGDEPVGELAIYEDLTERKRSETQRHEWLVGEWREHGSVADDRRWDRIVATARALLAGDGGAETRLGRLARLLVSEVADSCLVYLRDPTGAVRRVEVALADPEQESLLREQLQHYPPELDRLVPPVARALRSGESQLLPEVSIGALKAVPGDRGHVSVALLLGLTSLLVVPLVVDGRVAGAISLATAESGRRYHADDLFHAEEIARLAAEVLGPRLG